MTPTRQDRKRPAQGLTAASKRTMGKGDPAPCCEQEAGLARRGLRPQCHGCQRSDKFYDPDPSLPGRGQLLSGVRHQKQDKGQSDKQGKNKPAHGFTPFTFCAVPTRTTRGNHGKGNLPQKPRRFNRYSAGNGRTAASRRLLRTFFPKAHRPLAFPRALTVLLFVSCLLHKPPCPPSKP